MNVDEKTRNKKFFFVEFPGKIHDATTNVRDNNKNVS